MAIRPNNTAVECAVSHRKGVERSWGSASPGPDTGRPVGGGSRRRATCTRRGRGGEERGGLGRTALRRAAPEHAELRAECMCWGSVTEALPERLPPHCGDSRSHGNERESESGRKCG